VQGAQGDKADVMAQDAGQLVGELLDLPAQLAHGSSVYRTSMSLPGVAVPRAREPKIFSSAIPYRSHTEASAALSTSRSGAIRMA